MKKIRELVIPYSDAENFKIREEKKFFSDVYFRTDFLEELLKPTKYFLCGDKGAGKTAMAVYLCNSGYKNTKADHALVGETEIKELNNLIKNGKLEFNNYGMILETALLLRFARIIDEGVLSNGWIERYSLLKSIKNIITAYFASRNNPQIKSEIEILNNRELSMSIADVLPGMSAGLKSSSEKTTKFSLDQNLIYAVNTALRDAISKAKFSKRVIVFIDGLDNKSQDVEASDYKKTLSHLGDVVWSLNNELFGAIRDTEFRPKIVLLMRPELVELIGLRNSALRMRDNSVELNWIVSEERSYRKSVIFRMISHILSAQQINISTKNENIWDHYFPFKSHEGKESFILMLRRSYHRPRDILVYIQQMIDATNSNHAFTIDDFNKSEVRRKHSEYLLAEIRNGLEYTTSTVERSFLPFFFQHFRGNKDFNFQEYTQFHSNFIDDCNKRGLDVSSTIYENHHKLLQILYEINIIGYSVKTHNGKYFRWHFRERTLGDPTPAIPFDCDYQVHEGLTKALDVGAVRTRI